MEDQSKKPKDNAFQQQRLKAWQPLLTPKWVISTFLVVGVIFLPIGIVLLSLSASVQEIELQYDQLSGAGNKELEFTLTEDWEPPIYFYYKLTNFYQNHRRYVKSRSDEQLRDAGTSTGSCKPLEYNADGEVLYPCGLIAASVFNDKFTMSTASEDNPKPKDFSDVNWTKEGIAWSSDSDKFIYNKKWNGNDYSNVVDIGGETGKVLPRVDDPDFMVWMRTAGLPTFKKLHRIIDEPLSAGDTVKVKIEDKFRVSDFDGEKFIVMSTTSALGGKNDFLGLAYIIVGTFCLVFGLGFWLKHFVSPRDLGSMKYFSWPGSSANDNN